MSGDRHNPLTSIVLATANKGKLREFSTLLAPFGLYVLGLDSFPDIGPIPETGTTFQENALQKAREASARTGLVAVADDSGLEVDALGGAPGVYSARYSEEAGRPATDASNISRLMAALENIPPEERTARFRCCMAARAPGGAELAAEGSWEGLIAEKPAGENGFGYDPVFYDPERNCTAAQMSLEKKNKRSHRAAAVSALLREWPGFWEKWLENGAR